MRTTVVIPTHSRPTLLQQVLEGLSRQSLARGDFNVVVVDDGPPDSPSTEVDRFRDRLQIECVPSGESGLGAARNLGAARADGDLLVFLDDDVVPCHGFLEAHASLHQRCRQVVGLGSLPFSRDLPPSPFIY